MNYPCRIQKQDTQPYLAMRVRTPVRELPTMLGQSYAAIMAYLGQVGQHPAGMPFTAYYNQDMDDLDVEIGIPTADILPGQGDIYGAEIPAGQVGECIYTGPYSGMAPAYDQLAKFIADQGWQMAGPAYENYIDDPAEVPQSELRTQIVFPVRR